MKLKVLGSVSPYCNKKNNCPGYIIEDSKNKLLLDCGNGITKKLKFPKDLEKLTVVISHLHRDHYGDLLTLGYATYVYHKLGLLKEKVKVYIPNDNSLDKDYLMNMNESFLDFISYEEKDKLKIGEMDISFKKNPHPVLTFSIKVENNDEKIVYSSDTGYENNCLVDFAKNVDLLICEATFLENQKRDIDNHLSTVEAATIAKNANVKNLLLTHFWPEIPKRKYRLEAKKIFKNTRVAKEGKVLKLRRW